MSVHQGPSPAVIGDDPPEEIKKNVCMKNVCEEVGREKDVCKKVVHRNGVALQNSNILQNSTKI